MGHDPYIRLDGYDGQFMHFSCRSTSRADVIHTLTLDREQERATCSCEDATYRRERRWWYLQVPDAGMCKHLKALTKHLERFLKESGYL